MSTQAELAESLRKLADDWHDALPEITVADCIQELRDEIEAYAAETSQAQAQGAEWVLVPREPTEGMLKAAEDAVDAASNCESTTDDLSAIAYKAALAAAPQSQAADPVASVGRYPGGGPRLDLLVPPDRAPPEGALLYARAATPHVERMTEALRNLCAEMASVAKERGVSRDQVNTYRWCKRRIMAIVADRLTKTHPRPAQDAKDAARYRWLRDKSGRAGSPYIRCDDHPFKPMAYWITAGTADSCIDRAMAKESGNG